MWVDTPRKLPFKCHATGQDTPDAGPYYEGHVYHESEHDPRELTWYASRDWFYAALETLGSPFKAVPRAEYEALVKERDELAGMVDALQDEMNELGTKLIELEAQAESPSAEDIAVAVADLLEAKAA